MSCLVTKEYVLSRSILIFVLFLFASSFGSTVTASSIDVFEFSSDDNRQSYKELTRELRCPKCQNQDIADSNAPIAKDMRVQVHRLVEEGKTPDEIVGYMIERFGDFVTYKPKVSTETYLLWYGPWVFIAFGAVIILLLSRRKAKTIDAPTNMQIQEETVNKQAVSELLDKYSDDEFPRT